MEITQEINNLTRQIIGAGMEVHSGLGFGFLEPVYQKAMERELIIRNILFVPQAGLKINYKDCIVGNYYPDILVANKIIVELKALEEVDYRQIQTQIINYLVGSKLQVALFLNFGKPSLEFRRILIPKKFQTFNPL